MTTKQKPEPDIERLLHKISTAPKSVLRTHYCELFDREPPKAFGPDLLRRAVAYRIQENAYGGLSKATKRELNRLVRAMINNPKAQLKVARSAQSGTELVRDWKGKSHRVLLLDQGFKYGGRTYQNLSEIARLITGTRWNGPRFFGLRRQLARGAFDESEYTPQSRAAARPRRITPPRSPLKVTRFKRVAAAHGL